MTFFMTCLLPVMPAHSATHLAMFKLARPILKERERRMQNGKWPAAAMGNRPRAVRLRVAG
jgi:hypothetical protein